MSAKRITALEVLFVEMLFCEILRCGAVSVFKVSHSNLGRWKQVFIGYILLLLVIIMSEIRSTILLRPYLFGDIQIWEGPSVRINVL